QSVRKIGATSTVTSSANPSVPGQSVTFTATVTANSPGYGTPTGTVSFHDGSTILGKATLDASGQATFDTSSLAVGGPTILASDRRDASFAAVPTLLLTQTVSKIATTTAVTSPANPSITGAAVTYTATVSPVPDGGTVAFTDGTTPVPGCGAQPVTSTGTATCQATYTSPGSHTITAAYSGDATHDPKTAATGNQ